MVTGSVARSYVDHVTGLGLLEQVKGRLSPEALRIVEKPPLPVSWFESRLTDEIALALYELRSRDEAAPPHHAAVERWDTFVGT